MSAEKKPDFHVVNHSLPRRDGRVKVTGRATYVSDVKLLGMAYAKVLRSPYAHAKIVSIDTSRAEARAGVFCVLTGNNLAGLNPYYGHAVKDHPLLAIEKVRYMGEPVAADDVYRAIRRDQTAGVSFRGNSIVRTGGRCGIIATING